jgi:gliding-associated putative ABC transporter substrate-binding component GldG
MVNWNSKRLTDWLSFGILVAGLGLLGFLGDRYFFRLDLTEDKRYTLSEVTLDLLSQLEEEVYIEVYLEGDLPPGFIRLRKNLRETLEEFRRNAAVPIRYRFVNPLQAESERSRADFIATLAEKGIRPTNVFATEGGRQVQRMVFPGVMVSMGSGDMAVNLLKGNRLSSAEEALNQSIESVEYAIAEAIQLMSRPDRFRIGIVQGHGEWDSLDIAGLTGLLKDRYEVFRMRISDRPVIAGFDALIIGAPKEAFTEADKYKLDQYIMNGGKVLFFINNLMVNLSNVSQSENFAYPVDLNIDDLLFRYGVRVNRNFIQDVNSGFFPLVTGNVGDRPDIRLMPWPFYPIITRFGQHPITRNMDAQWMRFVSSVDTVKADGITKHPLLQTSPYTRVLAAPAPVRIDDVRDLREGDFNQGIQAVGYLLEGSFSSLYRNRFAPEGIDTTSFRGQSIPTQLLVVGDGDFIRNEKSERTGQAFPLGFDPYDQQQFANDDFLLNVLHYMLDDQNLILARNKSISIRPLDRVKAESQRSFWQILNLSIPVAFIVLIGFCYQVIYRSKYRKKQAVTHEK